MVYILFFFFGGIIDNERKEQQEGGVTCHFDSSSACDKCSGSDRILTARLLSQGCRSEADIRRFLCVSLHTLEKDVQADRHVIEKARVVRL